jgi:3-oxoacyl-[acyl-carrier-protein] synthase-1
MATMVDIVATGARTPVGLQAASTAAAVRAGIIGHGVHPFMTDQVGDLMSGALDPELDPHIVGPERLLGLAETALREVCAPLENLSTSLPQVSVYLGLPEFRPGFSQQDAQIVRSGLTRISELPTQLREVHVFTQGHAAGFVAFKLATERLRRGEVYACLVGGVDSYFHPDTMEWLDGNRQLNGAVSRSGFVPGEGAGFCLLMTEQTHLRLGMEALMRVRAIAVGKETKLIKTSDMCLGEGLSATVREAAISLHLPDQRINDVLCDINGERYRGEEWGFVCLRSSEYFDDPTAYLSPAECWGDMGAASAPLFAMLACQAAERGCAKGPRIMLWASSEKGHRGVAVLEFVGHG